MNNKTNMPEGIKKKQRKIPLKKQTGQGTVLCPEQTGHRTIPCLRSLEAGKQLTYVVIHDF